MNFVGCVIRGNPRESVAAVEFSLCVGVSVVQRRFFYDAIAEEERELNVKDATDLRGSSRINAF